MISTTSAERGASDDLFDDWLGAVPAALPELEPVRVDLVPLQRWYLEAETGDPGLWTASLFLTAGERLDPERLRRALAAVVACHPALRLRPFQDGAGRWAAEIVPE